MEITTSEGVRIDPENCAIKLFKNTKGYNWEIKVVGKNNETMEILKAQIDKTNKSLIDTYGDQSAVM